MELIFGIVAVAGLVLFTRIGAMTDRLRSTVQRLDLAEQELRHLRAIVNTLQAGGGSRSNRPARSAAQGALVPASGATVSTSLSHAAAAAAPVVASATQPMAVPTAHSLASDTQLAAATPEAPVPWAPPREREPSGPGVLQRLLASVGLATPNDGSGVSRAAVQAWLEGRMLAVVGGVALILGAVFFLSLAFTRGWITEPLRVLLGLGAGIGLLVLGELALSRLRGIVGHVLVAVGLSITALALLASSRLYELVPPEWALAGSFVAAVAAAVIALRHGSQVVAGFGLVTVLAAPPVMGAAANLVTLAFIGAALVGTTAIAVHRTWSWLPPLAFLLVAPQLASHLLGDAPGLERLAVLVAFWLVNVIAAGGEEARRPTDRLRRTTVTLLLVNAAYAVWAGLATLDGDLAGLRGGFVALVGLAHLALGLAFLYRLGDRQPFGLVVAATGVAALTLAVPIQLEGPAVPVTWAAEAVVLAWVAWTRRHPQTALAASALGGLALAHFLLLEYPVYAVWHAADAPPAIPFAGPAGITAVFLGLALLAVGWIVRWAWLRALLAGLAGILAAYAAAFELGGPALVWAWSAIALAAVLADGHVASRAIPPELARLWKRRRGLPEQFLVRLAPLALPTVTGLAALAALVHLVAYDFPLFQLGQILSDPPFAGWESLALAPVVLALAAVARLDPRRHVQLGAAGLCLVVLAYAVTFELPRPAVMVGWAVLALAGIALVRRLTPVPLGAPDGTKLESLAVRMPYVAVAVTSLFLLAQAHWYAPIGAFLRVSIGWGSHPSVPFLDDRTLAFAILGAACVTAGDLWRSTGSRLLGVAGAVAALAWLLPFELWPAWTVVGWSALALAGSAVLARGRGERRLVLGGTVALGIAAGVVAMTVAPPSRLWIGAWQVAIGFSVMANATIAAGSIAVLMLGSALLRAPSTVRTRLLVAAAGAGLYLTSVALVDWFRLQAGSRPLQDLAKESQVALSVLWSLVGGTAFAAGLRLRQPTTRLFGLAVLGLATAKVFAFDLASLDVAYRVLSLVALGVLLLVSAWVYARMQRDAPAVDRGVAGGEVGTVVSRR